MKFLLAIAVAIGVASIAYAAAAGVNVNGGALQQGTDVDLTCTDDVDVDFENLGGLGFADVVVTGFDDEACNGAHFYIEFLDQAGTTVLASCPEDTSAGPPGGILITGPNMVLNAPGDCDLVPIPGTYQIRVTIVGGGNTDDAP